MIENVAHVQALIDLKQVPLTSFWIRPEGESRTNSYSFIVNYPVIAGNTAGLTSEVIHVSAWLSLSIVPVSFCFGFFLRVLAITPREMHGRPWRRSEETTASIETVSMKETFDLPLDAPRGLHSCFRPFG